MPSGGGFAFGPYQLDTRSKRLLLNSEPVDLSPRQFALLRALVASGGRVITKDQLIQVVWDGVAVTDSSLEKLTSELRQRLAPDEPHRYIRTISRQGYQFVAPVAPVDVARADLDLYALLAPDRAWSDGLAALESLTHHQLVAAKATLERLVAGHPGEAKFRAGLALACALVYDATRADPAPDRASLKQAEREAHEACRLDPDFVEAWATLGFVLERTGDRVNALAALHRATRLEPGNWLHFFRLGAASWGEERLRAVRHTLTLNPGFAMALWLAACVWVARGSLDRAERDIDAALAAMGAASKAPARFAPIALYYLKGLLCLARGADDEALGWFDRELSLEAGGHMYARECAANTWYAKGALFLHRGDRTAARAAFTEALARVADHRMAHAGLRILDGLPDAPLGTTPMSMDEAFEHAAWRVAASDVSGAAALVGDALDQAPPGNAGWLLPIEPLLRVGDAAEIWGPVLARLKAWAD